MLPSWEAAAAALPAMTSALDELVMFDDVKPALAAVAPVGVDVVVVVVECFVVAPLP